MTRDTESRDRRDPGSPRPPAPVLNELMRILMIAPEPFFEPRGTPFSEYHRIRALLDLGHTVDLVTYPFGKDVTLPGLRIFRAARPPFITRVKIGPSAGQAVSGHDVDADGAQPRAHRPVRRRAFSRRRRGDRGRHIGRPRDSSSLRHAFEPPAAARELRVQPIGALAMDVPVARAHGYQAIAGDNRHLPASRSDCAKRGSRRAGRAHRKRPRVWRRAGRGQREGDSRIARGRSRPSPLVLYTGTFEAYQGLDLLFAAAKAVRKERPDVCFVLAGGKPEQVARAKAQAAAIGADGLVFTGEQPSDAIPGYLDAADVLVSPRSSGTNTPLKIYQYLRSGRAIVATRLLTHTQVLSDDVAILTEPTAGEFRSRHPEGRQRSRGSQSHRRRRKAARRHAIHLRGLPAAHARSLRRPGRLDGVEKRAKMRPDFLHYSYSAYADPAMAASFDAKRFGGPIGQIAARRSRTRARRVSRRCFRPADSRYGHRHRAGGVGARQRGAIVTGVDASREMLSVARTRAADTGLSIEFAEGDAHALAFPDRAFDDVVCLRMLMHVPDWRTALSELCRVSRRRVVFDYPALGSAAALAGDRGAERRFRRPKGRGVSRVPLQ